MDDQVISQSGIKEASRKKIAIWGCGAILICVLSIISVYAFALWGGGGESATLAVATRVSQDFVQSIHDQQIEDAHAMLSEKFNPQITVEQFSRLVRQDEKIFSTYKRLDICDWGFFISDGRVINTSGLLYYESEAIVVEISVHKDSDSVWRVQGFQFRSDVQPTPFGLCK